MPAFHERVTRKSKVRRTIWWCYTHKRPFEFNGRIFRPDSKYGIWLTDTGAVFLGPNKVFYFIDEIITHQ